MRMFCWAAWLSLGCSAMAGMLFEQAPTGQIIHLQYSDWAANLFWMGRGFYLDQTAGRANRAILKPIRILSNVLGDVVADTEQNWDRGDNRKIGLSRKRARVSDRKSWGIARLQRSELRPVCFDFDDAIVRTHDRVVQGSLASKPLESVWMVFQHVATGCDITPEHSTTERDERFAQVINWRSKYGRRLGPEVISSRLVSDESSASNKYFPYLDNLASKRLATLLIQKETIGSYNGFLRSPQDSDSGTKQKTREQNKAGRQSKPTQYLRFTESPHVSYTDPKTKMPVFDLSGTDVDVSSDGIHWVHLLGNYYAKGCPLY